MYESPSFLSEKNVWLAVMQLWVNTIGHTVSLPAHSFVLKFESLFPQIRLSMVEE